ncbi:hypothetical protein Ancab_001134 [Ancistrocladus abbreviatus]
MCLMTSTKKNSWVLDALEMDMESESHGVPSYLQPTKSLMISNQSSTCLQLQLGLQQSQQEEPMHRMMMSWAYLQYLVLLFVVNVGSGWS